MSENSCRTAYNIKDALNIGLLVLYFGCLLTFSSFFYLATEDYEAVTAVDFIAQGRLIGKSTGWPYTPLAGYLFYLYSLGFGASVLGFRLMTGLLIVLSTIPVYLTIRTVAGRSMTLALTLLSFSLSTFPHPRMEYFIEGSMAAYAIFFGVRFLQDQRKLLLYACALLAWIAYASRGHPNSSALLFLLPISLLAVEQIIGRKQFWNESVTRLIHRGSSTVRHIFVDLSASLGILVLTTASFVWLMIFLRNVVYKRLFVEYRDLNDFSSVSSSVAYTFWAWILLIVLGTIHLAGGYRTRAISFMTITLQKAAAPFLPFVLIGGLFIAVAVWVGYSLDELVFFIFPVDIVADHQAVGRIGGRVAGILPIFLVVTATTAYFYLNGWLQADKAKVGLFLLFLIPATFARFFPTYNMLYLGVFPVAVFLGCILPRAMHHFDAPYLRLHTSIAIFFIIYSVTSNYLLLARTQVEDLTSERLVKLQHGSLGGIFVEKDVFELFEAIWQRLDSHHLTQEEPKAFLSSRYVKLTPLIYQWRDSFAGQNLMIHLGKVWSYEDVMRIEGVNSTNVFDWPGLIYRWRQAVVDRLEQSATNVIVMSLYDKKTLEEELEPSLDPFREYLRQNFLVSDVIEPTMNFYRRSSFPEGAVIFRRKPQELDTSKD